MRGTWTLLEACRRAEVAGGRRRLLRQGLRAHDELPYREDLPLRPPYPYDASKAATDLIALSYWPRLRPAGRHHPLRQHLRRRRPQLLAPDPRGRRRRPRRPPPGDPLRRHPRARLPLRRRRGRRLPGDRARGRRRRPAAGEAFNAGGEQPHSVREVVELIAELAGTGRRARIRGPATRPARSTASTSTRPSCAS